MSWREILYLLTLFETNTSNSFAFRLGSHFCKVQGREWQRSRRFGRGLLGLLQLVLHVKAGLASFAFLPISPSESLLTGWNGDLLLEDLSWNFLTGLSPLSLKEEEPKKRLSFFFFTFLSLSPTTGVTGYVAENACPVCLAYILKLNSCHSALYPPEYQWTEGCLQLHTLSCVRILNMQTHTHTPCPSRLLHCFLLLPLSAIRHEYICPQILPFLNQISSQELGEVIWGK